MSSPTPSEAVFIGPFSVIDADTGNPIQLNRATKLLTAFARLDRYLTAKPYADAVVIDSGGRIVPRPHEPLPTPVLKGCTIAERKRAHRRRVWLRMSRWVA